MADAPLEGLSSLIQLSGVSVPARARFVGEAFVSSILASLTLGLSWGMLGAITPMGPLVPFLAGSWTGYTMGLVKHWKNAYQVTFQYATLYPSLLAHSLATERFIFVPPEVVQASEDRLSKAFSLGTNAMVESDLTGSSLEHKKTLSTWIQEGGIGRITWSILAAQSCRADVEELQRQQRQKLMEEHAERYKSF